MASGQTLAVFLAADRIGPDASGAQIDWILGASTPAETFPVLAFDTTTVEYSDFHWLLPQNYSGGGLTVRVYYSAGSTSGTLQWAAALRRLLADTEDLDTDVQTYDYNTVLINTLPNAIGKIGVATITFTNGADMDSAVAGDLSVVRLRRDTGSDTLSTDAYIHAIEIRET